MFSGELRIEGGGLGAGRRPWPEALELWLPVTKADQPLELLVSGAELQQDGVVLPVDCRISLVWRSTPEVWAEVTTVEPSRAIQPGPAIIRIPNGERVLSVEGRVISCTRSLLPTTQKARLLVEERAGSGEDGPVARVRFVLSDFPDLIGTVIRPAGTAADYLGGRTGRIEADFGPWRLTLDAVERAPIAAARDAGAEFPVSHLGELRRSDGALVARADADAALQFLFWLFSFASGSWSAPLLAEGLDAEGRQVWQEWACWRWSPGHGRLGWLSKFDGTDLALLAAGMWKRRESNGWETVQIGIHWLLDSNGGPIALEGRIVALQTALDRLAWQVLTQERGLPFHGAAQNIRRMLVEASTPTGVPASLPALAAFVESRGWPDGVTALIEVRDRIIHPAPKRGPLPTTHDELTEVWQLGSWFLQMALLWSCGYEGRVLDCRISHGVHGPGSPVPWAPAQVIL